MNNKEGGLSFFKPGPVYGKQVFHVAKNGTKCWKDFRKRSDAPKH